jgi:hypothetical protein
MVRVRKICNKYVAKGIYQWKITDDWGYMIFFGNIWFCEEKQLMADDQRSSIEEIHEQVLSSSENR